MSHVDAGIWRHGRFGTNASGSPRRSALLRGAKYAVVVAVSVVDMVQVTGDEIVGMATVLHHFVSAAVVVPVGGLMGATGVRWRAGVGVRRRYGHGMFVDVALVRVMQVAFVQVVGVVFM